MPSITDPEPYTSEDMFRESCEGRSLHDDCSRFYRVVMKLPAPLASKDQPSVHKINEAFLGKVRKDDLRTWTIIYSLFLTEKFALWPDTDECNHLIGILWKAYKG